MYVTSVDKVEECELKAEGANGVRVKYLLHESVGAKRVLLRLFIINAEGCTPVERHKHEHEVFILDGKGLVRGENTEVTVKKGDIVFIPSWEKHQFTNIGEEKLQFLCTKETKNTRQPHS